MVKLERLAAGGRPRVLDLFAGCGGFSLGFQRAGFEIVAGVEIDPDAARSHAWNFFRHHDAAGQEIHARPRDIVRTEPQSLLGELGFPKTREAVDVIIGGPPCQAFARVGRAKLREIAEHPEAFLRDPRGNLYLRYLRYVEELQPLAIVVENVPDVLNYGGHNITEEMCEALSGIGYECHYTLLNSAFYGVPQTRERMFLIGLAREIGSKVEFPTPTRWVDLPRGYEGSRAVALKALCADWDGQADLFGKSCYMVPPAASPVLPPAITAEEALADLPQITSHLEGKLKRGPRRFTEVVAYPPGVRPSRYARLMREWPGFESGAGVNDHVIRSLPRDYQLFRRLRPGDQYPEAHTLALRMFEERIRVLERRGTPVRKGTAEYERLRDSIVPPYDPGKFPNKWRKMEPDRPARTLLAHLGKDGYSHIHYDSTQARTISVREAARLQSFPDGFRFSGTMNPAFRQIGNAVPPLMANAIATVLIRQFRRDPTRDAKQGTGNARGRREPVVSSRP